MKWTRIQTEGPLPAVTQAELAAAVAAFETARDAYVDIRLRLEQGASVELGELDCRTRYDGFFGIKIIQAKAGWRRKLKAQRCDAKVQLGPLT
jgi:hypothetical protein